MSDLARSPIAPKTGLPGAGAGKRVEVGIERPFAMVITEVVRGAWFCSNPQCALHVRVGDAGVVGSGEWAVRG